MVSLPSINAFFLLGSVIFKDTHAFVVPSRVSRSHCWGTASRSHTKLEASSSASAISSNEDLLPGISAIDEMNADLLAKLVPLRDLSYFRLYSVDMLASCEYLPQELFECFSQTCEIYPVDDELVCIYSSIITLQTDRIQIHAHCLLCVFRCRVTSRQWITLNTSLSLMDGPDGICQAKTTTILMNFQRAT